MAVVTAIKPQKSFGKLRTGQQRVNIYLNDKFGFGLDLETFVKSGIKIEKELTESEIEKIIKEGEFQKTYQNILRFASLRPRSEKEFKDWLKRKKVHESIIPELFNKLKHLDFLNDEKFAGWWIEQRLAFKPKSLRVINYELRMKGINPETINKVLAETRIDEIKMAKEFLEKKKNKLKNLSGFEKRKKISNILLSQGFGWNIIREFTDVDD